MAQWGSTWSEIFFFFTPKLRRESRWTPRWSRLHQTKSPRAIGAHLRARRDSCRADFGPILWRGRDGGMKERGRQFGNRFSNSGFLIAHRNFLKKKSNLLFGGLIRQFFDEPTRIAAGLIIKKRDKYTCVNPFLGA